MKGTGSIFNSKLKSSVSNTMSKKFSAPKLSNYNNPGPGSYQTFSEFGIYKSKNADKMEKEMYNKMRKSQDKKDSSKDEKKNEDEQQAEGGDQQEEGGDQQAGEEEQAGEEQAGEEQAGEEQNNENAEGEENNGEDEDPNAEL